jgi:hypothetical protein
MAAIAAEANFVREFILARGKSEEMIAVMHTLPIILGCQPSEAFIATMCTFGCGENDLEKALPNFRKNQEMALVATAIDALQSLKEKTTRLNEMLHTLVN